MSNLDMQEPSGSEDEEEKTAYVRARSIAFRLSMAVSGDVIGIGCMTGYGLWWYLVSKSGWSANEIHVAVGASGRMRERGPGLTWRRGIATAALQP